MKSTRIYCYSIDAAGLIEAVDEAWLEFASRNEAPELTRDAVLGRPIDEFVAGEETRRLYELLYDRVRHEGASITVPFRCDSPRRFRFMQLHLDPGSRGSVSLRSRLLREEPRPHLPMLDRLLSGDSYEFPICSFCKRIMVFGEWLQPEGAVARMDMFGTQAPVLDYRVCRECESRVHLEQSA